MNSNNEKKYLITESQLRSIIRMIKEEFSKDDDNDDESWQQKAMKRIPDDEGNGSIIKKNKKRGKQLYKSIYAWKFFGIPVICKPKKENFIGGEKDVPEDLKQFINKSFILADYDEESMKVTILDPNELSEDGNGLKSYTFEAASGDDAVALAHNEFRVFYVKKSYDDNADVDQSYDYSLRFVKYGRPSNMNESLVNENELDNALIGTYVDDGDDFGKDPLGDFLDAKTRKNTKLKKARETFNADNDKKIPVICIAAPDENIEGNEYLLNMEPVDGKIILYGPTHNTLELYLKNPNDEEEDYTKMFNDFLNGNQKQNMFTAYDADDDEIYQFKQKEE